MALTDEEQPLLRTLSKSIVDADEEELEVDFEPLDPEDPRNWRDGYKWCIVLLLACMAFTVTFTCIGVVPIASRIVEDLDGHSGSSSTSALLVTSKPIPKFSLPTTPSTPYPSNQPHPVWELGESTGPLFIAPLSELHGRAPLIHISTTLFILFTLLAAFAPSTHIFIAARALTGLAVSTNVLAPSIIGDMFASDQRGSAMSLIMLAPLVGGAIGPAMGGAIAQRWGWRWVLYIAAALAVLCEGLFMGCFGETYRAAILRRRNTKLGKRGGGGGVKKLWHSITRPFAVLFGSAVLVALSAFAGVAFSFFYVMSISLPVILTQEYGFSPAETGAAFMSFSVGSFLSVLVCNFGLDRIYIALRGSSPNAKGKPEYRLPLCIFGGFAIPLAVTAFGWVAEYRLPAPWLLTCVSVLGFTLLLTMVPLSAYVVDAFGMYSASAMTGVIVMRCLAGTFLPLGVAPLVERLGYGWGFTVLGGVSMGLAVVPVLILVYGERLRQRSEFTRDG